MAYPKVKISRTSAKYVKNGHPWVTADRHTGPYQHLESGAVVDLIDEHKQFVGRGILTPDEKILLRIMTRKGGERINETFINKRVKTALQLRKDLMTNGDTDFFRLINAEGDFLPGLVVDYFGGYVLVVFYSLALEQYLESIIALIQKELPVKGIYRKNRPQNPRETFSKEPGRKHLGEKLWGQDAPELLTVKEYNHRFLIACQDFFHPGIFIDQRENRRTLAGYCNGKTVLNLFCHTSSFSVYAHAGGAKHVENVDISQNFLDWSQKNYEANGIESSSGSFIKEDVFQYLKKNVKQNKRFDLLISDPSPFSTSKKSKFTQKESYTELSRLVLENTKTEGFAVFCANMSKISMSQFKESLAEGAKVARCQLQIIEEHALPCDFPRPFGFPEGDYLKFLLCRVLR